MYFGLAFFTTMSLSGCTGKSEDKVEELEMQVMDIHDEVMPKMETIVKLTTLLSLKIKQLDSLQQEGVSSNTFAEQRIKAVDLQQQLALSDSLMMEWMYNYKGDSAKALDKEKALDYFKKEMTEIVGLREKTFRTIQEAEAFLKK